MKKVVLVTGASSGIGKATAKQLIEEGHIVYGAARRVEKMEDLVSIGGHALKMDVTDSGQVAAAVNQVISEQGRVDVLVNNAGYSVYGAVEDVSPEDAQRQFDVNLFGLAEITRQVLPHMRKAKSGKIINVSSAGGRIYTPLGAWYHATKHALEGWSDSMRLELKPFNIDVVVIRPGLIGTEFGDVMSEPVEERAKGGAYEGIATAMTKMAKAYGENPKMSSPPSVIAGLISKAVAARKPKTRYVGGKMAKPMLFMRKYLSDRTFDKVIMSRLNKLMKQAAA